MRYIIVAGIAIPVAAIAAFSVYGDDMGNKFLEWWFLGDLKKNNVKAIPRLGTSEAAWKNAEWLSVIPAFRELLADNPEVVDALITNGLAISGLEKGPLGVGSEQLDLDEMARAQWIVTFFAAAANADRNVVDALRDAHQRSKERQAAVLDPKNWKEAEEARVEAEQKERDKIAKAGRERIESSGLDPHTQSIRLKEFEAALDSAYPVTPIREKCPPQEVPLTLIQILIRHGLHRLSKDTVQQYEEEIKKKRRDALLEERRKADKEKNLQRIINGEQLNTTAQSSETALTLEQEVDQQVEKEWPSYLEQHHAFLTKLVEQSVEKILPGQAWLLLKLLVEPDRRENLHLYGGGEFERFRDHDGGRKLSKRDEEIRKLRGELLSQSFVPLVLYLQPPPAGQAAVMPLWGPEGTGSATDLLGAMLFDIPDLSTVPSRYGDTIKNAMFSALGTLASVYAEQHLPGGSVCAFKHLLELDPHNAQVMTQLAVEMMKLGQVQLLRHAEEEAKRATFSAAKAAVQKYKNGENGKNGEGQQSSSSLTPLPAPTVPVADMDPRSNPFLSQALQYLRSALTFDPNHLDANFHYTKLLVLTREKDEKKLNKAADGLINAVRAAPTELHAGAAPSGLPGADWSAPFAEVHPILSPSYNLLIRTLEHLHRYDDALELAREWSWRIHADSIAHFTLGRLTIKYGLGETNSAHLEAERALMTAVDLDPSKPETYYQLALLAYKVGAGTRDEEAEKYVRQALEAKEKVDKKVRDNVTRQYVQQQMALNAVAADAASMYGVDPSIATSVVPQPSSDAAAASSKGAPAATTSPSSSPSSSSAPPPFLIANSIPRARLLLSKIALRANPPRFDDALREVDLYLGENKQSTDGYMQKATILEKMGRSEEAYESLTKLVRVWSRKMATSNNKNKDKNNNHNNNVQLPTRKQYFANHPAEAAMYQSIERVCSHPNSIPTSVQQMQTFKNMCEEINNFKKRCK